MKVVIPVAGWELACDPTPTPSQSPSSRSPVSRCLAYILDQLKELPVDEVIYIVGHLGGQIEEYVRSRGDFPSRFVEQKELRGQAHALHLAADAIDQPVPRLFCRHHRQGRPGDIAKYRRRRRPLRQVRGRPTPLRSCGRRRRPRVAPRGKAEGAGVNLAVVGVYYLKDWQLFKRCLQEVIDRDIQTAGEYYLADALQLMIHHGARLDTRDVDVWEDCGTVEAILQTNRWMLGSGYRQGHPPVEKLSHRSTGSTLRRPRRLRTR